MSKEKLGIIAGAGLLPIHLANLYKSIGGECVIANSSEDNNLSQLADSFLIHDFKIGNVGKILYYFKENNIKKLILVGSIPRPNLRSVKVDRLGGILIAKILKNKFLGDNNLLSIIAKFIEEQGLKIISPNNILSHQVNTKLSTKTMPTKQDKIDIEYGFKVAYSLGLLDIGQTIVIEGGYVIGVEAAEGTDNLIKRCADLRKGNTGGILIKIMKPNQDIRLDIPTIGPTTLELLAKYKYSGISIKAEEVIILDKDLAYQIANKDNIFINLL